MDTPVDLPLLGATKDYIVAFGHLKLIKDRNTNDNGQKENKRIRKPVLNRLPRNIRSNSSLRNPKSNGQVNIIPGNVAGTSYQIYSTVKSRTDSLGGGEEKLKPSQIPRRRSAKEFPTRETTSRTINKNIPSRPKLLTKPRNIQRVQHLNVDPEFCPTPPKPILLTPARPIPTLGHIYRQDLSNETLTDWYLESVSEYMNTPQDSIESKATVNTAELIGSGCTSKFNDDSSANDNLLEKQATVVISKGNADFLRTPRYFTIPKVNTEIIPLKNSTTNIHKPLKYPSTPNPSRKQENIKIPVASYVEYPSEVLQKTTNFETEVAYATSSNAPDLENDNNSSQWTIDHVNESSAPADDTAWSRLQTSEESNLTEPSKTSYLTDELWREHYINDKTDKSETNRTKPDEYSSHDYFKHYCWRKEVTKKNMNECPWDYRGRCKKCQKYRKTPDREKTRRPFQNLKSRIWIRRNCRFGWGRVWKRTAERWAHWSRSTYGVGKLHMNDLKKSLIWDNANVQTTILVYRETGTDAVVKEQKSAEITTSHAWASFYKNGIIDSEKEKCFLGLSTTSARSTKSPIRHVNIGPSMFPFLYYPPTVLIERSPIISKQPIPNSSCSARNSRENKFKEVKNVNSPQSSRLRNKSNEGTRRSISKSTSLIALPNYISENATETENVAIPVENKVTSTMIHFSNIKLAGTVSQDAYTQMCVTCSNAATDIKYTPPVINESTIIMNSTDEGFYYGVDRGTEMTPPINKSQRSIPIMTSRGIIQELTNKETQVSPEPATRKFSMAVLAQELYGDAKSSIVTETSVPCRKFDNTHLVTSKGTILSCTGTKVTSVSSAQIQTASETSRISRNNAINTVNTAISTNFVVTKNTDCLTTPSVHRSNLEDASMGTDKLPSVASDRSTSCAVFKTFADVGVSTSNVLNRVSYNGGSHYSQNSFCTVIHPECSSICVNTDVELNSKSTGTGISFDDRFQNQNKSTSDCHFQCSEPLYRSNEIWDNSRYVARIGRSRLMSVRMLSDSVTEMATQAQPVFQSAETNTAFKQKMSASVFTSRYAIGEPLRSSIKVQPKETGHILTCHCANTACDTKPIDAGERKSQVFTPVRNDVACKTNSEAKSVPRIKSWNEAARQAASNAEANFVISSNLNATKWMKGCIKESDKDVQSIISISETMVTESLDRASLVIATSKDRQSIGEIKKVSEVVINHQPAVGCVTTAGYHPSSSQLSIARMVPTKDENTIQDKNTSSNQHSDNDIMIVNKITSDEITTKSIKDSIDQLRQNLRDTGTSFDMTTSKKQSASVLTSRHILPNPPGCKDSSKDCIFVYDRPRCIVHSFHADAVAQTELQPRNSGIPFKKHGSMSSRSVGLVTSSRRSSCSHPKSSVGDVLSPKVYKALYETTKLIAREGSESTTPKSSTTVKEESETTVPKSSKTEKRGSVTASPDSSFTQPISKKTENEDVVAAAQMTSCLLSAPAHCYCARCLDAGNMNNRSIQTVTETVLLCPHCNARISRTHDLDRESMKSRSIQAAGASLLNCPQCRAKIALLSNDSRHESAEECIQSYLVASCRYYSNLLTIKLAQVKDNFKKHIAPPIEGVMYQAAAVPNIFHRTQSNNIIYTEACTMKPSGRRDENCEAKLNTNKLNKHSLLYPALSLTDVRGHGKNKNDLKDVYYILTAIEGRVRRLKSNLTN